MIAARKQKALTAAVGYIRMSTDLQEDSPKQQRKEITKLAEATDCRIIRWYEDHGITGDSIEERDEFCRMVTDATKLGDFEIILAWDVSRFGRFDMLRSGVAVDPLRKAGVKLVTTREGTIDWRTQQGRMMYFMQSENSHQFLQGISAASLRGRISAAMKGEVQGQCAFGYDRVFYDATGKLVHRVPFGQKFRKSPEWRTGLAPAENSSDVELVRWIFREYVTSDIGVSGLVVHLNRKNIRSPWGKYWTTKTVGRLLSNPVYAGHLAFGRQITGHYNHIGNEGALLSGSGEKKYKTRNSVRSAPIIIENTHEALIDAETFAAAQAKHKSRANTRKRSRESKYILTGVLKCGHCGGPMNGCGKASGSTSSDLEYYACTRGAKAINGCKRYRVRRDQIEGLIMGMVHDALFDPKLVKSIRATITRLAKAKTPSGSKVKDLEKRLVEIDKRIQKATNTMLRLENQDAIDAATKVISQWAGEKRALVEQVAAAKHATNGTTKPTELVERALSKLQSLRECYGDASPHKMRAAIQAVVADIRLWWEPTNGRNRRLARGVVTFAPANGISELSAPRSHAPPR